MKIGFIGGNGHHYLRSAAGESNPTAVAGDGHDNESARGFATALGAPFFESAVEMFEGFQPEVVSVGAVYGYNGDLIAQALERGLPVVSDKPIAATWPQLERLRALCADPARILLTEFPFRAQSEFQAARAAVRAGRIGEVVLATAQKSYRFGVRPAWYGRRQSYGGTLLWVASHAIDVIGFCTGAGFGRVVGTQGNLSHPELGEMEDHCAVLFELTGGATAIVHADYLRPTAAATHGDDRLRLAGTKGILEVRDERCLLTTAEEAEQDITASAAPLQMHQELLAALRGESDDLFSTEKSLQTAALLLRARDAADSREWGAL